MRRPTFIIAEPEPAQALSARKLVLQTAKYNVITSHSVPELMETIRDFPNVEAIVLHTELADNETPSVIGQIRTALPKMNIIALTPCPNEEHNADSANHRIDSHDPQKLLSLLEQIYGRPLAA